MDSVRLAALKQLSDLIRADVTPGNGYDLDLSTAVFRGRLLYGDDDPLPMVSILEGIDPDRGPDAVGFYGEQQTDHWTLLFQGWVDDDNDNPTDPAHNLMAAVKKSLTKIRKGILNQSFIGQPLSNAVGMTIEPGVVRPPDGQLSNKAYFWMRVILKMVEEVDEPFWSPP
jgi:hypothetical protein